MTSWRMKLNNVSSISRIKDKAELWTIALAVVVGTFLRFFQIDRESLWLDEAYSVSVASLSIPDLLAKVAGDIHPPFYYLMLHFWIYMGQSEFVVRSLSAVLGILTIVAVYYVARALFGSRVAAMATLLVAISPMNIWLSQETRMYSLLTLLSLLSLFSLYQALRTGGKIWWVSYVASSSAMLYTHYYGFFILPSEFLFSLAYIFTKKDKHTMISYILCSLAIIALFAPWIPTLYASIMRYDAAGQVPHLLQWGRGFVQLTGAYLALPGFQHINAALGFLLVSLFSYGILMSVTKKRPGGILMALALVMTFTFSFLIAQMSPRIYNNVKYTLFLIPEYAIIISFAMANLSQKLRNLPIKANIGVVILLAIVSLNVFHLSIYYHEVTKPQIREAAEYIKSECSSEDLIIFDAPYAELAFNYYSTSNMPQAGLTSSDVPNGIASVTRDCDNIWLVLYHNQNLDVKLWLDENYRSLYDKQYHRVRILHYHRVPPETPP